MRSFISQGRISKRPSQSKKPPKDLSSAAQNYVLGKASKASTGTGAMSSMDPYPGQDQRFESNANASMNQSPAILSAQQYSHSNYPEFSYNPTPSRLELAAVAPLHDHSSQWPFPPGGSNIQYELGYHYDSQMDYMFSIIPTSKADGNPEAFDRYTRDLWTLVIQCKEYIKQHPMHTSQPDIIRQYYLEKMVWGYYWSQDTFPGQMPTQISIPIQGQPIPLYANQHTPPFPQPPAMPIHMSNGSRTTSTYPHPGNYSNPGNYPNPHAHQSTSAVAVSNNSYTSDEILHVIKKHKAPNYMPVFGWDPITRLPPYHVIVTATNGFRALQGPALTFINAVRQEMPGFRIMYQNVRPGLLIIWLETHAFAEIPALSTNDRFWASFTSMWAFFQAWSDRADREGGVAVNINDFMVETRGQHPLLNTDYLVRPMATSSLRSFVPASRPVAMAETKSKPPAS